MQRYDNEEKKEKISNLYLSEYCGREEASVYALGNN
jgi:hypothetical protein